MKNKLKKYKCLQDIDQNVMFDLIITKSISFTDIQIFAIFLKVK
jgi:hypothetical protein